MNPNNCATCDHKRNPDGGHCYMFRDEPSERCFKHTDINEALRSARLRRRDAQAERTHQPTQEAGG